MVLGVGGTSVNGAVLGRTSSAKGALSFLNVGGRVTFAKIGLSNAVVATQQDFPIGPNERLIVPIPAGFLDAKDPLWVAALGSAGNVVQLFVTVGTHG
jgi:hypothetical protein